MNMQVSTLALQGRKPKVQPLIFFVCTWEKKLLFYNSGSCWIVGKEDLEKVVSKKFGECGQNYSALKGKWFRIDPVCSFLGLQGRAVGWRWWIVTPFSLCGADSSRDRVTAVTGALPSRARWLMAARHAPRHVPDGTSALAGQEAETSHSHSFCTGFL